MVTSIEPLKSIIYFASRAPSAHNSQPWKFLSTDNGVTILPEMSRSLPVGDPDHRELWMSLGCAVENIVVASHANGVGSRIVSQVDGIKIEFVEREKRLDQAALENIEKRHTNRDAYTNQMPSESFISWVRNLSNDTLRLDVISDQNTKTTLADIAIQADIDALGSQAFRRELAMYLRSQKDKSPVGITVPALIAFLCKYINLGKLAKKQNEKILKNHTPVLFIISTKTDDRDAWIMVGQIYERISLEASRHGMVTGPWSAPIVIKDYYRKLQHVLGTDWRPQFFSRLGYETKPIAITPRLSVNDLMAHR